MLKLTTRNTIPVFFSGERRVRWGRVGYWEKKKETKNILFEIVNETYHTSFLLHTTDSMIIICQCEWHLESIYHGLPLFNSISFIFGGVISFPDSLGLNFYFFGTLTYACAYCVYGNYTANRVLRRSFFSLIIALFISFLLVMIHFDTIKSWTWQIYKEGAKKTPNCEKWIWFVERECDFYYPSLFSRVSL